MALFTLIPTGDGSLIEKAVAERFGKNSYRLPKGELLVRYNGTSKQLCEEVGLGPDVGGGVVFGIGAYWGFADKDLWEWLSQAEIISQ